MKQSLLFALSAISFALFLSCGDHNDPALNSQIYLQGTVKDVSSGIPIVGAEITLSFGGSTLHQGKTDGNGSFSFPISQSGDYKFFVKASGYEDTEKLFPLTDLSKNEVAITMMLNTYLTIKNESTFALEKVTWNGVDFGSMAVNAAPVKKIVKADRAQITFSVPGKDLNAKTNAFLEIKPGEDIAYSISDTALVAEINEAIAGIFDNVQTLKLVEKADAPKTGNLNITDIGYVSAKLNSSVAKPGNPQFTEKGFCYSKELGDIEFNCVAIAGEFIKIIDGLSDSTKYYVKTYISNGKHPKQFSEAVSFITLSGIPSVSVGSTTNVSYGTATLNGSVLKLGSPNYVERGFCYGTNSKPEKGGANVVCEAVAGTTSSFQLALTGLADSTKYFVRAYIDNGKHTIQYSDVVNFTTLNGSPSVSVGSTTNVSYGTATLNGSVLKPGSPSYTERGFCYGTNLKPEKGGANVVCEAATGTTSNFQLAATGLTDSTRYYVRAYIDNAKHVIQYSDTMSFTTLSGMPNVALSGIANVTTSSALLKGTVLNTTNTDYTEKGFCYSSTNDLPVKGTSTATCEIVAGEQRNFELELTSLQIAKTYYVRAYVENNYGARYSDTASFKTNLFVDDRDNKEYKIKDIGSGVIWFMDNLAYNAKTQYSYSESRTACPSGWRLPSDADWETLKSVWAANKDDFTASSGTNNRWWSSTTYTNLSLCYHNGGSGYYNDNCCTNSYTYNWYLNSSAVLVKDNLLYDATVNKSDFHCPYTPDNTTNYAVRCVKN